MKPHDLREFLRAKPFAPFRFHTSEGRTYEIRHPDEAIVLDSRVVVPSPVNGDQKFPEHVEHITLAHIVRAEEIKSNASQSTN